MFALFLLFASEQAPTSSELIRKAIAASESQQSKDLKYTYREDHEQFQLNKQNQMSLTSRKTYDVIMLEGENYRKLILVDGKPLDEKLQKKVDEDLEKTRARRKKRSIRTITRTVRTGGLEEVEKLFNARVTGEETLNGRKAWRIEAEPKPGIKTTNKDELNALNTRRTFWIDQQEGRELRRKTEFLRPTNGFQPGSEIDMTFQKVGEAWLIDNILFRFDLKAMAVMRGRGESRNKFYDYRLYQTDSRLVPE